MIMSKKRSTEVDVCSFMNNNFTLKLHFIILYIKG